MNPLLVVATGETITFTGGGFRDLPTLNCKFGNLMATAVTFLNNTAIQCTTPNIADTTQQYLIQLTLNGVEYQYFTDPADSTKKNELLFTSAIVVDELSPIIAFESDTNVVVKVTAAVIYNVATLSCKMHDYITTGTYYLNTTDSKSYVYCTIPSFQFIVDTATNAITNNEFAIEISNNGVTFSNSGKTFKFIVFD